jgi:hypothetical protein
MQELIDFMPPHLNQGYNSDDEEIERVNYDVIASSENDITPEQAQEAATNDLE